MTVEKFKREAGYFAAEFVQSDMVVGLGEGSTAIWAIRRIAEKLHNGDLINVVGVPCSNNVERNARELGVPIVTFEEVIQRKQNISAGAPLIDISIDGADEVDPEFNLIKGAGGALLREKIVAQTSAREVIVVDEGKLSSALGMRWHVPIEVLAFGLGATTRFLQSLGGKVTLRIAKDSHQPFVTDQGNVILDTHFGVIADPRSLAAKLGERAGIVEHGIFVGITNDLVVAGIDGVRHMRR